MLSPSVVGQGEDGEDAAPELVASYQSLSRELLGLHDFLGLRGAALLLLLPWAYPCCPGPPQYQAALRPGPHDCALADLPQVPDDL